MHGRVNAGPVGITNLEQAFIFYYNYSGREKQKLKLSSYALP